MIKYLIFILFCLNSSLKSYSQGKAYNWLLGYQSALDINTSSKRARLHLDSLNAYLFPENFKMPFAGAEANISDENGNLLFYTNGCWIANSTGDTMQNGSGLNPGPFANVWCKPNLSIPWVHSNLILPFPSDTNKYLLLHQTTDNSANYYSHELFSTLIDMSLDSGFGGVDSNNKNTILFQDTLSKGIAACKHANGRDWWIVALKEGSDVVYKLLLTPNGISFNTTQTLNVPYMYFGEAQFNFSPDGTKFAYTDHDGTLGNVLHNVRLFDFDRCTGNFSNPQVIDVTDNNAGLGLAFSPNSQLLYACSFERIFQINTSTYSVDTVAVFDGFASPNPPFYTTFWTMYLAPNGKIYITTANGTLSIHVINSPDSTSTSCDVQQHSISTPCYAGRDNVNHPNYYLGAVTGSVCDSLTNINETEQHNFKFQLKPNPTNGNFSIMYLLPQNKQGTFKIFDINGKTVYSQNLPQWSTLQNINVSFLSKGIYNCLITSNNFSVNKKLAIIN